MSSGPERFVTEKAEREAADSAARPKVSGKNCAFSAKRQAVWFEMQSISN